ncbi:FAD-dependent oxidoreductase [Asanoa sp. WMMD1127]|uniref:FAD-dependent oxidoreductase n=1 Tax=Asanoa sp. WMMD1127 TaxID=3016107 RepID=UPI002416CCBE|nr:FAD-dependent oxidoreductase [Asanoa sp. WMMD1127]MDG4820457.1 FAD-dependent oxidoreductase [Asanoa sp. WMMD1127]
MRVVVIGGGVAGVVSALALRRRGAEVTVYEAHPDPAGEVGSFVSLAVNGLRGLAAVDCLERVQARGLPIARLRMWSAKGHRLADVPRGRRGDDPLHSVTLMRGHLVAELRAAAAEAGVELVTGERLTTVDADGTAHFAGGLEAAGDLLVGADGLRSVVRGALDRTAPTPRYAGVWVISGRSPGDAVAAEGTSTMRVPGHSPGGTADADGTFNMTVGAHGAFIHVVPPGGGEVWWQAQVNGPVPADLSGIGLDRLDDLFAGEPVAREIIAATTRLHRPSVNHVLDSVRVWHAGRTVLVGDAAHPVGAGQGASMAIEDGVALAATLDGAASIAEGLARYEAVRRPRVDRVLRAADDNREVKQAGPLRRRLTEVGMSLFMPRFYERATGWLYDYDPVPKP